MILFDLEPPRTSPVALSRAERRRLRIAVRRRARARATVGVFGAAAVVLGTAGVASAQSGAVGDQVPVLPRSLTLEPIPAPAADVALSAESVPSVCDALDDRMTVAMATVATPADVDDVALIAAALIESCGWSEVDTTIGGRG